VLWQQGESDVIAKTTTEKYGRERARHSTHGATAWGVQPPWLLAKSTLHPTVYNDPEGEGRIRKAIDELAVRPGFQSGPDTDTLTGKHRGDAKSRRHFSALGQAKAAEMWAEVLKKNLNAPRKVEETLADLHLLTPAWASPVVHRESSVLLQMKDGGRLRPGSRSRPPKVLEHTATVDGRPVDRAYLRRRTSAAGNASRAVSGRRPSFEAARCSRDARPEKPTRA